MRYRSNIKNVAIAWFSALAFAGWVQAQDCEFSLGPDTTLCDGQNILLHGPSGALSIVWQNGFVSQNISAVTSGIYWCTATFPQAGGNIVVNGDFSQGDVDFTTAFQHGTPGGPYGLLSDEGTYAVTTDPSLVHNNFASCADHTGGGQMLVVNGSAQPNANIWCQTITVIPDTYYAFSAWLMSVTPDNPAEMDFLVNGNSLGTPLLASNTLCEWNEFYAVWNSGNNTSANICIINQQLATSGNDFALDDITFSPLCSYTDSIEVTVLPQAPVVDLGEDGALCPGTTTQVQAQLVPPEWPYLDLTYSWSTGELSTGITVPGPGTYTATVEGRCVNATASVTYTLDTCETDLTMPNVFSPNGDGVNDSFGPIFTGEPADFSMVIRNRWGQEVFTSSKASIRWNGRAEGGVLPSGTYFWTIQYGNRSNDGSLSQEKENGTVTLLGGH
ncbi:MAG: gliding motility-associated C-terminal domain-containing protein [Flavobacteriales bacterium]|nr:gliding motility-associated C-terminal domain-containing protein [Flavobacteriales bacterium]